MYKKKEEKISYGSNLKRKKPRLRTKKGKAKSGKHSSTKTSKKKSIWKRFRVRSKSSIITKNKIVLLRRNL